MSLEQEKKWREEIQKRLEAQEKQKAEKNKNDASETLSRLEYLRREQIRKEEEEKFYKAKGYVRAKNKYGEFKWMSPEEAAQKKMSRKKKRRHSKKFKSKIPWIEFILASLLIISVFAVYKYYKSRGTNPVPTATIHVQSNEPGAAVFLNGRYINKSTPATLEHLSRGKYWIVVDKPGYDETPPFHIVNLEPGKTISLNFNMNSVNREGQVVISGVTPPFELYIDGFFRGIQNETKINCPEGWHLISLSKSKSLITPYSQWVFIQNSNETPLSFKERAAKLCSLYVYSNIYDAYITINRKNTGRSPGEKPLLLPEGDYEIRLIHPQIQFLPESRPIQLKMQAATEITITGNSKTVGSTIKNGLNMMSPLIIDGKIMESDQMNLIEGSHLIQVPASPQNVKEKWLIVFKDSLRVLKFNPLQQTLQLMKEVDNE